MSTLYISPTGSGSMDGSSAANAGVISQLSSLIAQAGPGGEVRLIADQGAYSVQTPLSISDGGAEGMAVTIRGVSASGAAMAAEIVGTRSDPWGAGGVSGQAAFDLVSGADHLRFTDLAFKNIGDAAFRVLAEISDIRVDHVTGTNLRAFFDGYNAEQQFGGTVNGLHLSDISIIGYSRAGIRLGYNTNNVVIENVYADSQRQYTGVYIEGVQLDGTVHDVLIRDVTMNNNYGKGSSSQYWNGDGFCTERGVYNVVFEDTVAIGNTDAGYDIKSSNTLLLRAYAEDNKRNFRIWSDSVTVEDSTSVNPHKYGGSSGVSHIWLRANADAYFENFHVVDTNGLQSLAYLEAGATTLWISDSDIPDAYDSLMTLGTGAAVRFNTGPDGLLLDNATVDEDSAAGTVVGTLSAVDVDTSDQHVFSIVGGSDKFEISGDQLLVKAGAVLDFETRPVEQLTVRVTDQGKVAYDQLLEISVQDDGAGGGATLALAATDAVKAEGDAGLTAFTFTVTREGDLSAATTVNWAVSGSGGAPAEAADFENAALPAAQLSFDAGQSAKTIVVEVAADVTLEFNEGFTVTLSNPSSGASIVTASAEGSITNDDTAAGGGTLGPDSLTGGTGGDTIDGAAGNDTIDGLAGDDRLLGGQDDDLLQGGAGADSLDGGAGIDAARYSGSRSSYSIDLNPDGTLQVADLRSGSPDGVDSVAGVENFLFANGTVSLASLSAAQSVTGGTANDIIGGGLGADTIYGGSGKDTLSGGGGNDFISGGLGDDSLRGGGGHDTLDGSTNYDRLFGEDGDDRLSGGSENDTLDGGAGNDTLLGEGGADNLSGGAGDDSLDGGYGGDVMAGGAGNDSFTVDAAVDQVTELAGGGIDTVKASIGYTLGAEVENLTLTGGAAINGVGNGADNVMVGNAAANSLTGLGGADNLSGGGGNDTLIGGLGADTLSGGAGGDRFVYTSVADSTAAARDLITGFTAGSDKLDLVAIDAVAGGANDAFTRVAAFSNVAGQLTVTLVSSQYEVRGDVNGDGVADLVITITGAAPGANDILL